MRVRPIAPIDRAPFMFGGARPGTAPRVVHRVFHRFVEGLERVVEALPAHLDGCSDSVVAGFVACFTECGDGGSCADVDGQAELVEERCDFGCAVGVCAVGGELVGDAAVVVLLLCDVELLGNPRHS